MKFIPGVVCSASLVALLVNACSDPAALDAPHANTHQSEPSTEIFTNDETSTSENPPAAVNDLSPLDRAALLRRLQEQAGAEYALTSALDRARSLEWVNPAQGFWGRFETGTLLLDAERAAGGADEAPAPTKVELRGVGRGENLSNLALTDTTSRGNRVELQRERGITEWYANGPGGLEHGLVLSERPTGTGELVVDLAVDGLSPRLEGDRVVLHGPGGREVLSYRDLITTDATQTLVPSEFRVSGNRVQIVVDDSRATYPLSIDPNWVAATSRITQAFGSSTNHNVTMPATVDAGDLLLVLLASDGTAGVTTPSGWTELFSTTDPDTGFGDSAEFRLGAYAKDAAGNEDGTTVNFVTSGSEPAAAHVIRVAASAWEGTISTALATATSATGENTSPNPPTANPAWGSLDTLWVPVMGHYSTSTVTAPANYTTNHARTMANGDDCGLASSWRATSPLVASEDPSSYTLGTSRDWISNTIAIMPPCESDANCNDGNTCTVDTCTTPGPTTGVCNYVAAPSATVCRASTGVCDAEETCGGATTCPADAAAPSNTVCRASVGVCDLEETCGGAFTCPADAAAPPATVCRASVGVCDVTEMCGGATTCPADVAAAPTTVCRSAAGVCDVAETCDGATVCPADLKSTTQCRAAVGVCDAPDMCDGVSDSCPADAKSTAVCRPAVDACDAPEVCDGVSNVCAGDSLLPRTAVCRASAGACDTAETCTGSSAACPADAAAAAGTPCGNATSDDCTAADTCDGNFACQSNHSSDGTTCGGACGEVGTCTAGLCSAAQAACSDGDACNGTETCGGASCVGGTPLDCDDAVACTIDSCGSSRCSHAPDDTVCNTAGGEVCNRALGCSLCGNGVVDAGEECDEASDTATCDEDCTLPQCGDGWVNAALSEECDGSNLDGHTCESQGSGTGASGVLACDACTLVTSGCDGDADGLLDGADNCPDDSNADQSDSDADGTGDACDAVNNTGGTGSGGAGGMGAGGEPPSSGGAGGVTSGDGDAGVGGAATGEPDADGDGVPDATDSCVSVANPAQSDADGDGRGDCCDPTPGLGITVVTLTPDEVTTIEVNNTIITVRRNAVSAPTCVVVSVDPEGIAAPSDGRGDVIGVIPDVDLSVPGEVCFWVGATTDVTVGAWIDGEWVSVESRIRNGEVCANVDVLTGTTVLNVLPAGTPDSGAVMDDDMPEPDVMIEPAPRDDPMEEVDAAVEPEPVDDMDDEMVEEPAPPPDPNRPTPSTINTSRPMVARPDAATDAGLPPATSRAGDDGGCSTTGGPDGRGHLTFLLLALVGLRRRGGRSVNP